MKRRPAVILTRPAAELAVWAKSLDKAGFKVQSWPLIEVQAHADLMRIKGIMSAWHGYQAIMFVSRAMGGSCSMPLAAHAVLHGPVLDLHAAWGNPEDLHAPLIRAHSQGDVSTLEEAEELGLSAAKQLRAQGAR